MNAIPAIFLVLLLLLSLPCSCKVLIITTAYNRPDFVELQDKHFKKFVKDEYEFVVFSDASTQSMQNEMKNTCERLGVRIFQVPQECHSVNNPSNRNATSILVAMNTIGFDHEDLVVVIDSDMFLIKPFSFREYLGDHLLAALPQSRGHVEYMWVGLMIFNMPKLPDRRGLSFSPGVVDGVGTDTGGSTYYYLKSHPEIKLLEVDHTHTTWISNPPESSGSPTVSLWKSGIRSEFLIDYHFFHYQAGTNWNGLSGDEIIKKTQIAYEYLEQMYNQ